MPSIPCNEGQCVEASPSQGIDFGGVTSCMTITCILSDGTKVAAHDAVFLRVTPQIFQALKGKINKRTVKKVVAAGSGSSWTPRMASQMELSESFGKEDPSWASKGWEDQLDAMSAFLVSTNEDRFLQMLAWQFGVTKDKVSYTNYDDGRIQVSADGTLSTG